MDVFRMHCLNTEMAHKQKFHLIESDIVLVIDVTSLLQH